jgi:murein DD-endopeptidase MepM/ murein hydrolase activator NlpD
LTSLRRSLFAFLVLALAAVLTVPAPVRADGLILDSRTPGVTGPQVDAAAISPAAAGAPTTATAARTHVVQPGETLSAIAERYGLSTAELISRNALADPDSLAVGQVLALSPAGGARFRLPAASGLTRVQLWPWPPTQGQTLVVWLEAREPISLTVSLNGEPYPVMQSDRRGWAVIPIGPLTAPGLRSLRVGAGDAWAAIPMSLAEGVFPSYDVPAAVTRPILGQTAKVNDEAQRVTAMFATESGPGWAPRSRFALPLDEDTPHSDPFGSRRTYGGGSSVSAHAGEDFSAAPGTEVKAPAAGTVLLAEPLLVRGNAVMLDHGGGVVTGYWHLQEINVAAGDRVEVGQLLGKVGSTGLSTGAHLHWELRIRGVAVDPMQWVAP